MPQLADTGTFATANASRYLQQLCRHFAHKVEVSFDAASGRAALPPGPATFSADAQGLRAQVTADTPEALEQARRVVDSHLARFACREGFERMEWRGAAPA
ncbi:DUF2218 domain-containing protein [Rhodovulum strictum]|uniref:DUF2218 domain-containing protein n=1 Tax=Rhodovulum strictum TaxID=58314 RepID=A0A844BLX9_9RHOB|nr:DUF2218 domain-containing protein [Rhodovulum strictum]MRH22705.1 DUF2218 domain-containing protein [Rhodovulum strictum]